MKSLWAKLPMPVQACAVAVGFLMFLAPATKFIVWWYRFVLSF